MFVQAGVTLLLINLSNQTEFSVDVKSTTSISLHANVKATHKKRSFLHGLKECVSWVGSKASDAPLSREEYHLTPEDGELQSRTVHLNGRPLQLKESGDIPSFSPVLQDVNSPVSIAPLSIKFIVFPNFIAPGCQEV